jgi:uncharacterized protein (DUF433 family)
MNKRIVIDPKIMRGKPVIRGTRIPVYVILNLLVEGYDYKKMALPFKLSEFFNIKEFYSLKLNL